MDSSSRDNPFGAHAINNSVAMGVMATVAVALRLLARSKSKAALAIDDWLIVGSLLPLLAMVCSSVIMVKLGGLGRPIQSLDRSETTLVLKTLLPTVLAYSLTITIVKLSILLLYRRLFVTRTFKLLTLSVAGLCMAWFIAAVLTDIFQCHPISAVFDATMLFTDKCIDLQAYYWGITAANMVDTIVCEYVWSLIEPATAILCACVVTYRPLCTVSVIPAFLSKSFSSFSRGKRTLSTHNESNAALPVARDILGREVRTDHDLYSQAGKGALHVVSIGHVAQTLAERQNELDGRRGPGVISVRRSVEITSV
ncbi:ubiquitin carboxyl-terminal hydrolase 2 [Physcia stellaris]|nr:ubiquitin carboxyl-terminal hydrolase 2 [Physcia stellaris]